MRCFGNSYTRTQMKRASWNRLKNVNLLDMKFHERSFVGRFSHERKTHTQKNPRESGVFDTQLKALMFCLCRSACGGLQLPASFWGVLIASSLPSGITSSLSYPLFSSVFSYFPPPLTHHFLLLLNLLCFFPSFHPLRAAGSARSLLQGSELITSVLDRRATRGHTLPEDRSIHARGNRGTGAGGY